uniref:uncharacterized protein LOC122608305 n=1 Tax=Erigeron canadensis TaxID=72917 RepID=UPI001CB98B6F|nr:uncharacterized protein LOC122608305 [Erigeron canadensis]
MKTRVANVNLINLFRGKYGDGSQIIFWLDPWICDVSLKEECPILLKKDRDKKCLVREKFCFVVESFVSFETDIVEGLLEGESEERRKLNRILAGHPLKENRDTWVWIGNNKSGFNVKAVKEFLRKDKDYSDRFVFSWSKWVPKKGNIFMWRLAMDRLPTLEALKKRNCVPTWGHAAYVSSMKQSNTCFAHVRSPWRFGRRLERGARDLQNLNMECSVTWEQLLCYVV